MRIVKSPCAIAGLAVSLIAPALVAQAGIVGFTGPSIGGITGAPYTGTRKTTRVQTLADGTKITHESIMKVARDSAGKIYRENHVELPAGSNDGEVVNVNIFDPVNRVQIFWSTRTKQATIFHQPDPQQARSIPTITPKVQTNQQPNNIPDPAPQVEDLGTQTINGVTAVGRRITRVIPAGKQGNDQPITITNEIWRSPELNLIVREIHNDPRSGLMTTEFTDLQQGEPDPMLFQIPAGYTVKEQFPNQN